MEIETTMRCTVTCEGCKIRITAEYRERDAALRRVEKDFEFYGWRKQEGGGWLCPDCSGCGWGFDAEDEYYDFLDEIERRG